MAAGLRDLDRQARGGPCPHHRTLDSKLGIMVVMQAHHVPGDAVHGCARGGAPRR